ncbi:GNAT family N-acetyltransferase [Gemmobacter aquarius]|uniref:GNAT family N-acetyltransferase n=1 Tax=Paragemmobacter aquarius TaxID=2169400 RepID=A0A2S0UN59_9RHOB|nr:GNAT family N-acetyltransferase [Gemmobacter aquarius]AWB49232.1 GNAT family N-acetyltransferase [Gemmobacter aquarius]
MPPVPLPDPERVPPPVAKEKPARRDAGTPDPLHPTVFHEPWWLDAAAPNGWHEVTATTNGRITGRLPYLLRPSRLGGAALTMPDYCHFLGPAIDAGNGAPTNRALRRDQIIRDLIAALPPHGHFTQRMHRGLPDIMAFSEAGFQTFVQFTYEIAPDRPESLWSAMRDKTRNTIRRAEDRYSVTDSLSPTDFAAFYTANANASGAPSYYRAADIARVTAAALSHDRGRILAALTPQGAISAAIFCIWDATACYYLLSMRDRGAENGATGLLLWQAIRHAAARGLIFDFDGLLTRGNRVFFTGFGGTVHPRYIAKRQTLASRIATRIPSRLRRLT